MKKILMDGDIGYDVTLKEFSAALDEANGQDVIIEINSPGGSVIEGMSIAQLIRSYEGGVTVKILGIAASMASYIAVQADKVVVSPDSIFMVHNPTSCMCGEARDMYKMGDLLNSIAQILVKAYAEKNKCSLSEVAKSLDDETYYFGDEIVEAGYADSITDDGKGSKDNSDSARNNAKAKVRECLSKLNNFDGTNDFDKLAALCKVNQKTLNKKQVEKKQEENMELNEFLLANCSAALEHKRLLADAAEEAVSNLQNKINKVVNYIGSEAYKSITPLCVKVLKGESDVASLEGAVVAYDLLKESMASTEAQAETNAVSDTLGDASPNVTQNGEIKNEQDRLALVERLKNKGGI